MAKRNTRVRFVFLDGSEETINLLEQPETKMVFDGPVCVLQHPDYGIIGRYANFKHVQFEPGYSKVLGPSVDSTDSRTQVEEYRKLRVAIERFLSTYPTLEDAIMPELLSVEELEAAKIETAVKAKDLQKAKELKAKPLKEEKKDEEVKKAVGPSKAG